MQLIQLGLLIINILAISHIEIVAGTPTKPERIDIHFLSGNCAELTEEQTTDFLKFLAGIELAQRQAALANGLTHRSGLAI